ncbi:MAG: O-antigen ligase family protein [Patescibacteria group bacterium]
MKTPGKISLFLIISAVFLFPFYFFRFDILGIPTNIFEIAVALSVLSIFYFVFSAKRKLKFGPLWPYFILLAAFLSVFLSIDEATALGIFKGWFAIPFLLYFSIINIFTEKNISKLIFPLYISSLLVALWTVAQKASIVGTLFYQKGDNTFGQYLEQGRTFGPFESPNFLAMFLVPAFFLSIIIWPLLVSKFVKICFLVSLALPLTALYFSQSKAGILALVFSVIFAILIIIRGRADNSRSKASFKTKSIFLLPILASIIFAFLAYTKIDLNSGSNNVRKEIYSYSWQMAGGSPIKGIGLGSFQDEIASLSSTNESFKLYGLPYALHPHNIFLAFWLYLGALGILAFLSVLAWYYCNLFKIKDYFVKALLFAGMTAVLIHGLFDTTYFKNDLSALFWLLLALTFIYRKDDGKDLAKS